MDFMSMRANIAKNGLFLIQNMEKHNRFSSDIAFGYEIKIIN